VKRPLQRGGEIFAPEDWPGGGRLLAPDGRKLKDAEFVGASTPDADPAGPVTPRDAAGGD
jgi:hypothetical protein